MLSDVRYPVADYRRTAGSILLWWESRRLVYNVAVGTAGLLSLLLVALISLVPPGFRVGIGWQPIVAFGVLANVCYTFGFALEALAQYVWKDRCPPFAPALFRQGLVFSVGLALLPVLVASITWVTRVVIFFTH